jgi:hypothetical protein
VPLPAVTHDPAACGVARHVISTLFLQGGHLDELREAFGAAFPVLFAAVGVSILLAVLAAMPPSALGSGAIAEFITPRRRQLTLVAISICFSTVIAFAIVFWAL